MARSTLISLTTRTLLELLAIFGGKKWKFWFTDSEETVKKYKQEILVGSISRNKEYPSASGRFIVSDAVRPQQAEVINSYLLSPKRRETLSFRALRVLNGLKTQIKKNKESLISSLYSS